MLLPWPLGREGPWSLCLIKIATIDYYSNKVRVWGSGARGSMRSVGRGEMPSMSSSKSLPFGGIIMCLEAPGGSKGPPGWILVLGINAGALRLAGTGGHDTFVLRLHT